MLNAQLNMDHNQYINFLAIDLLEALGNDFPSQQEIDIAESFISDYYYKNKGTQFHI